MNRPGVEIICGYRFDFVDENIIGIRNQVEALQEVGKLSSSQGEAWLAGLTDASTAGAFFFAGLLFTVVGRKP